jgi:hypothetical protein
MRTRAEEDAARAPHRLSEKVFFFDRDGLRPL